MKIERIQFTNSNTNFKAGKVRVFSDFDKTFLPSSTPHFESKNTVEYINMINNTFKNFRKFLDNTREGLKFTITTGRTFGEFLTMAEIARKRDFKMPLPDTLIIKNGSSELLRVGTDEEFYRGGEFPFKYEVSNKEKEEKIKQISGWDGEKVRQILFEIFKSHNLKVIEADTEHDPKRYVNKSFFSEGNLKEENPELFTETNQAENAVGLRRDGSLKIFALLKTGDSFKAGIKEIQDKLDLENIKYTDNTNNPENIKNRKGIVISPMIPKYPQISGVLTKCYDIGESLDMAIKNQDLVIAAGDGDNDIEMLNPALYFYNSLSEEYKQSYPECQELAGISDPKIFIKKLEDHEDLAEIFKKMPFIGIILKNEKYPKVLETLKPFCEGKYKKIIVAEQGELEKAIKEALKFYCDENPEYKEKLSKDLEKEINAKDDSKDSKPPQDDPPTDNPPKKSNLWKYILGGVGFLGVGGGAYYLNKKQKEKKTV